MILTAAQLAQALDCQKSRAELWIDPINAALDRYEINEPILIAAFLAQIGHESARLTAVEENLNYSANGLRSTFPKYFTTQQAGAYARKPKAIANRVYANRMGNGDERSGDGWRYRGKGLIQITGKDNHAACGEALGLDLLTAPELLMQPVYAAMSAAWYWASRGLNKRARDNDIRDETRVINGGTHGLADRQALYDAARAAIGV